MEQNPNAALQADFLDLRRALSALCARPLYLALCCAFSAFTAMQAVVLGCKIQTMGPVWGISNLLFFLLSLLSAFGLWTQCGRGRAEKELGVGGFRLLRAFPLACMVLGILFCVLMSAVLLVVLFSNSLVRQGLLQLSGALEGTYYSFLHVVFGTLGNLEMTIVTAAAILAFAGVLLLTLRFGLLAGLLRRLRVLHENDAPARLHTGFLGGVSYVLAVLLAFTGVLVCRHNLTAGLCLLFYAASLFLCAMVLGKVRGEVNFLYTYYEKLNASLRKQAALKAQQELLAATPARLPAPPETGVIADEAAPAEQAPAVIVAAAAEADPIETGSIDAGPVETAQRLD